jgi:amino acid permease
MLEAGLLYRFISSMTSYLGFSSPSTKASTYSAKCRSGFTERPDFTSLSSLGVNTSRYSFPSYPLYIFTVAASYLFLSLDKLSKELEALGPAYSSRYYSSMIFLGLAILVIFSFRLLYECDNFGVLAMTLILAFFVGLFLVEQNTALFGTPSMNLIGIPLLRNRTANGQPIYICPTKPAAK